MGETGRMGYIDGKCTTSQVMVSWCYKNRCRWTSFCRPLRQMRCIGMFVLCCYPFNCYFGFWLFILFRFLWFKFDFEVYIPLLWANHIFLINKFNKSVINQRWRRITGKCKRSWWSWIKENIAQRWWACFLGRRFKIPSIASQLRMSVF